MSRLRWIALVTMLAAEAAWPLSCAAFQRGVGGAPGDCRVADPSRHLLALAACEADLQCPMGTTCAPTIGGKPGDPLLLGAGHGVPVALREQCATTWDGDGGRCVPLAGASLNAALLAGFQVEEFTLTKTVPPGGSAEFNWKPPGTAKAITCVLFGCAPSFQDVVPIKKGEDHQAIFQIDNYDQCALASWDLRGDATAVGLSTLPNVLSPGGSCDDCVYETQHPALTALAFGCWAYDEVSLIGATRMFDVEAAEIGENPFVSTVCEGTPPYRDEGTSCPLDVAAAGGEGRVAFGACHHGVCRKRCVNDGDCPPEGARLLNFCLRTPDPGAYLGVCVGVGEGP